MGPEKEAANQTHHCLGPAWSPGRPRLLDAFGETADMTRTGILYGNCPVAWERQEEPQPCTWPALNRQPQSILGGKARRARPTDGLPDDVKMPKFSAGRVF